MVGKGRAWNGNRAKKLLASVALSVGLVLDRNGRVRGQDVDLPNLRDDRFKLSQVYSTVYVSGSATQTLLSPCSDHLLLIGKAGDVKIYPAVDKLYTYEAAPTEDRPSFEFLVTLGDEVNSWGDHGLLSAQLHPDFPSEPYLFLFYSVAPKDWTGECNDITSGLSFCEQNAILQRLKVDVTVSDDGICSDWSFRDSAANRVTLMEDWCSSANAHHNAAMEFYPEDGSLLVANGDSAQAGFDSGYPDTDKCYDQNEPKPQGWFKSQNDKFLQGHLVRIKAESLLYGTEDLPLKRDDDYDIWAKGLRNPFRMDTDISTGDVYIGDVGHITIEEINILRNPLKAAGDRPLPANFGWPCLEGDGKLDRAFLWATQTCDSTSDNCEICDKLFACEAGDEAECDPAYVAPSFQYSHREEFTTYKDQGDLCSFIGSSVSAIAFFGGRLYAADYSKKCLWFFEPGANGAPDMSKPVVIADGAGAEIVDLVDGKDGFLYATNFALTKIVRVDPVGLAAVGNVGDTGGGDGDGDGDGDDGGNDDSIGVTTVNATTTASGASNGDDGSGNDSDGGDDGDSGDSDDGDDRDDSDNGDDDGDNGDDGGGGDGGNDDGGDDDDDAGSNNAVTEPEKFNETQKTSDELEPPNARLRVTIDNSSGFCGSPCKFRTGTKARFTGEQSGSYGSTTITKFSISYGDGSEGYSGPAGSGHSHAYESDGVFVAELTVTDSLGLTGSQNLAIVVGEPFNLEMTPESKTWSVGDTIQFNLTRAEDSATPERITWASAIEHCTTNKCTGKMGCHMHSLSKVDTAPNEMSGSFKSVSHDLPSQVIITAQMTFKKTNILDYAWTTESKSHEASITSIPPGLAVNYGEDVCPYTPCVASFMSKSSVSFVADSIQSTNLKVYEFRRWKVSHSDDSIDISNRPALNNLVIDYDGKAATVEYTVVAPEFSDAIDPPVITALGGYYTNLHVEWASIYDDAVDHVIVYAVTPDYSGNSYQSSKAVPSGLVKSAELIVPRGESNYTVYLRAYNTANNTLSGKSEEYVVLSAGTFNPDNLCPDDIPAVGGGEGEEGEEGEGGVVIVPFSEDASPVPGVVEAEDYDEGGEGVAYHDDSTVNEGMTEYRKKGGVDLEEIRGTINIGWTKPGEWVSYTVQHPGGETVVQDVAVRYAAIEASNGIALALDLAEPNDCAKLYPGHEKVVMMENNLPVTGGYRTWAWTQNATVSLEPGPHVVTLCFVGKGQVNVDLLRFGDSKCGDDVCDRTDGGESCSTCPQDCKGCPSAYKGLPSKVPGDVQAEDFDLGGAGVGFYEKEGKFNWTERQALYSDYRNEAGGQGLVSLREAEGRVHWSWTEPGEWLHYTVSVIATADYSVTLRYASSQAGMAHLFIDGFSCNVEEDISGSLIGSPSMPSNGGDTGPFARTSPFKTRLKAGEHGVRVCVVKGSFTLDEISFDLLPIGPCNDDGTCDVTDGESCYFCNDCTCTQGDPYETYAAAVPGFVEAYRFDEGQNGVAYWDDTESNIGNATPRETSVDIQAGADGTYHVAYGVPGEWLKYTVRASKSGLFDLSVRYSTLANTTALAVTLDTPNTMNTLDDTTSKECALDSEGLVLYNDNLPSSGAWDIWAKTESVEVALPAGPHVLKLCIVKALSGSDTNLKGFKIKKKSSRNSSKKASRETSKPGGK